MPKPKGSSKSWIDLAMRAVSNYGRGIVEAWKEGEAEVMQSRAKPDARKHAPHRMGDGDDDAKWWQVLGVSQSATKTEITKAYRLLVQQNHPDKVMHMSAKIRSVAEKETKRLNHAYEQGMKQA